MNTIKKYSELIKLKSFEERLEYLKTNNVIGHETFGYDRYLNQKFYKSNEWKQIRNYIITRDLGCDLAYPGKEILYDKIIVHHMNPISKEDILNDSDLLLNPEYLITVSHTTHEMIHYNKDSISSNIIERSPNDTCPWKKERGDKNA